MSAREPVIVCPTATSDWIRLPSGLVVTEPRAREIAKPRLTCVDLFAGCGGFSLGVIQAGFDVVCAVENDPVAALTYLANLGAYPVNLHCVTDQDRDRFERVLNGEAKRRDPYGREKHGMELGFPVSGSHRRPDRPGVRSFILGDIREVTGDLIRRVAGIEDELDLVVGGPPCQGFSTANRKHSRHDPRNPLVFEFARLIVELRPKTFVMENVPNMLNMVTAEGLPVVDAFCRALDAGGYASYEALRKMMGVHPKARAGMRGRQGRGEARTPEGRPDGDEQQSLFTETAA